MQGLLKTAALVRHDALLFLLLGAAVGGGVAYNICAAEWALVTLAGWQAVAKYA
jgi:hypothetical protein